MKKSFLYLIMLVAVGAMALIATATSVFAYSGSTSSSGYDASKWREWGDGYSYYTFDNPSKLGQSGAYKGTLDIDQDADWITAFLASNSSDGYHVKITAPAGKQLQYFAGNGEWLDYPEYTEHPSNVAVLHISGSQAGSVLYYRLNASTGAGEWLTLYNNYSHGFRFQYASTIKPAISGQDVLLNNVSNPLTVSQIMNAANIIALDEYDGNITDKIQVVRNTYSPNANKKGTYEIEFTVKNSGNLSTNYVLTIINKDITPPTISGPEVSTISYKTGFNANEFLSQFSVSDDSDASITLRIESDNYRFGVVADFTFVLSATDTSGNKATFVHTLKAIDDVAPIFTDSNIGLIRVDYKQTLTNSSLIAGLTATDEVDGLLNNKITIKSNNIVNGKLGFYTVVYEVIDQAGNKASLERQYEIFTSATPVYYVSENLLLIEDVNKLTTEQIVDLIASYSDITVASYRVLTNTYTGNENTIGTYAISLLLVDEDGLESTHHRTVNVFSAKEEEAPEVVEVPWYESAWNSFMNVLKAIANFFISLWNHLVSFFRWLLKLFGVKF